MLSVFVIPEGEGVAEMFLLVSSPVDLQKVQQETDPVIGLDGELLDETGKSRDIF